MPRAEIYQRRKDMNLCVQCAMRHPVEGGARCRKCREIERLDRIARKINANIQYMNGKRMYG